MFIFRVDPAIISKTYSPGTCVLSLLFLQEGKIADLEHVATRLIDDDHYAKKEIAARLQRVLDRSGLQSPLSASAS